MRIRACLFERVIKSHGLGIAVVSLRAELPPDYLDDYDSGQCTLIFDVATEYRKASIIREVIQRLLVLAKSDVLELRRIFSLLQTRSMEIVRYAKQTDLEATLFLILEQDHSVADLYKLYRVITKEGPSNIRRLEEKVLKVLCSKPAKMAPAAVWRGIIRDVETIDTHASLEQAARNNELKLMIGANRFARLIKREE